MKTRVKSENNSIFRRALAIIGLAVLFALTAFIIQELDVVGFVKNAGLPGAIIYTIYVAISGVIVILPAVPLWPTALLAYGYLGAVFFSVLGSLGGAVVSFWIARNLGRDVVVKFVGKKALKEAEETLEIYDPKTFFVLRLLASSYFDTVSYIAGLSSLPFKYFITLSAIASVMWHAFVFALMAQFKGLENTTAFLGMFSVYAVIILVVSVIWKTRKKRNKRE